MRIDSPCAHPYPGEQAASLVEILRWRAAHQAGRLAYVYLLDGQSDEVRLTYRQLHDRASAVAARLQDVARPGERALLLYPPGPEFLAAFLGCLCSGIVAIPLFPPRPNRTLARLEVVIEDAGATSALAPRRTLTDLDSQWSDHAQLASVARIATDEIATVEIEPALASVWRESSPGRDDLAFLQYTSGSTSVPKGVMVTHGNLIYNCAYMQETFSLTTETVSVTWLPHFHDMGLIEGLLNPLFVGFPAVVMPPAHFVQRPLLWLQAISRFRASHGGAPNFAFDLCARKITPELRAELDLSCWTMAYTGAEPVRSETLDRFAEYFAPCGFRRESLCPGYGLAEATLMVSGGDKGADPIVLSVSADELERGRVLPSPGSASKSRDLVGCGHARRDTQIAIVEPHSRSRCAPDQIGEIWVAGPTRAAGYWHRDEESQATFAARLVDDPTAGPFLRTGDLGALVNGEIFITGRLKDLIIVRGGNFYPQDVEWTAENAHAALRRGFGAAFSVELDGEERLVVAYEIDRQFRKAGVEELQAIAGAIRQAISQEFDLDTYCVTLLNFGAVPKTSSGKIQRQACRADFLAGCLDLLWESRLQPAAPTRRDETDRPLHREQLASLRPGDRRRTLIAYLRQEVSDVLDIALADVTSHQPLGALGLDSLKGNDLTVRLQKNLQLDLPATLVWNYPTIAQLAAHLAAKMDLSLDGQPHALTADKSSPSPPHANGAAHPAGSTLKRTASHPPHRHADRSLTGKASP